MFVITEITVSTFVSKYMGQTMEHLFIFIYLGFSVALQHCIGHITTGSFMGRGNQYIQLVMVLYRKLPTISKKLPTFPNRVWVLNH